MALTSQEKTLYNQIHPAKLVIDIGSTVASVYLLWEKQLLAGIFAALLPPVIASAIIIMYSDLEKLRDSPLGQYI